MTHPRGTILRAPGDTPVIIVTPGEHRARLLIGDVDWTLPSRVVTCLHAHGYEPAGVEDDAAIERRLAQASEALRVRRTGLSTEVAA